MSTTFISRKSGSTESGAIVLWYGTKAAIPDGWVYYSEAVGKLVAGALTASTTALGDATHTHLYTNKTGTAGYHKHTVSMSVSAPINMTRPGHFTGATKNAQIAADSHTNHAKTPVALYAAAHDHSLSETGSAANLPESFGLYFIRKV